MPEEKISQDKLSFSGDIDYTRSYKTYRDDVVLKVAFNLPSTELGAFYAMQALYGVDAKITFKTEQKEASFIGKIMASASTKPEGWRILIGMEYEQVDGFKGIQDMFNLPVNVIVEVIK